MTPIERLAALVVGTVESVSPGEIRVLLEPDAPQVTALNTGTPAAFPRINGYVLLPNEAGATVAYIAWIGIERSPYPKRSGLRDFGLIDLPFPLRKMSVSPVGTLTLVRDGKTGSMHYELARGVLAFPSVGDQVLLPTAEQVEAIVGARDTDRRIRIGSSPLASNASIMVDPDKLFGRHLAILGNTGSGKSCTVAGLIRWSLEAAQKALVDAGRAGPPNARFVVLDPNGEYARAFSDSADRVRVFRPGAAENPLVVPAWMWNSHEWAAMTQAQPGAQRPLLVQALRGMRAGKVLSEPLHVRLVREVRLYRTRTLAYINDGSGTSYMSFGGKSECFQLFKNLSQTMRAMHGRMDSATEPATYVGELADEADAFWNRHAEWSEKSQRTFFTAPSTPEFDTFLPLFDAVEKSVPEVPLEETVSEDSPVPFDVRGLPDHVEALSAESTSNPNLANFISTLTLRIRSMLADRRLAPLVAPEKPPTFQAWLESMLGGGGPGAPVAVIDLSLVPSEVTHIVVAVLARLVFEASQRYRKLHKDGKALPTVLVLEEAHTFVRRGEDNQDSAPTPARLCKEVFERIAREGRKFGVGLVLSSQRPSELSQTVLAQCNTFMLHRLVNDADQELVTKLVPDNVGALLKELPSLPSRQAIMLGWATPIPVLVEVNELPLNQRPHSADPDFWDVWRRASERPVDWTQVASDWSAGG